MIFTPELKLLSLLHIPLFCVAPRVESQRCLKSLETQDQPPGVRGGRGGLFSEPSVKPHACTQPTRAGVRQSGFQRLGPSAGSLKPSNMAVHPVFVCVCRHNSGRTSDQDDENMQSTDPTAGAEPSDHMFTRNLFAL